MYNSETSSKLATIYENVKLSGFVLEFLMLSLNVYNFVCSCSNTAIIISIARYKTMIKTRFLIPKDQHLVFGISDFSRTIKFLSAISDGLVVSYPTKISGGFLSFKSWSIKRVKKFVCLLGLYLVPVSSPHHFRTTPTANIQTYTTVSTAKARHYFRI